MRFEILMRTGLDNGINLLDLEIKMVIYPSLFLCHGKYTHASAGCPQMGKNFYIGIADLRSA